MSDSDSNKKKFDSVNQYRIRKLLSELSNKSGRGTELVTLYLPPKKPVHEAIAALREESGTASNIKSDTTRTHVEDALTKTMQRLRLYKQTPENGLVIFCGALPGPGGPGNEVIQLFEVLPSKPVTTYLYRCLAPETKILLQNGLFKTIDELRQSWISEVVKTTRENGRAITSARITDYIQTLAGERRVYRLVSESGRTIIGTEDHPFLTPKGWRNLGGIKVGDLVCVYPSDDLDIYDRCQQNKIEDDTTLVDEDSIRELPNPPANIELTLARLKERGLLPLTKNNPRLTILARILGHIFSDSSFTHNVELRNARPYSHFTLDICVGDEADEDEIRSDLISLGARVAAAFRTTHRLNIDGRSYTSSTIHIKFRDTPLCSLLRALGAPTGSKVKNGTDVPRWLFEAPPQVQREFLAAYMGGDGEAPRIAKSNPISALRLTFHRIESLYDQAKHYAQDISILFSRFGIRTNAITARPGYFRKDGTRTFEFELQFAISQENVLRICHGIGYRYSKRKSAAALLVGEYLRIRAQVHSQIEQRMSLVREVFAGGSSVQQISASLSLPQSTVRSWVSGTVNSSIVRSTDLGEFSTWLSLSRVDAEQLLLWESVVSIEEVKLQDVRDITLEDGCDHSFFANGFLVHNCDDHFHLDPLREMLREENVVGILSMDATEAGLGIVSGDTWEVVDSTTSGVSGKTRKGGQSARRYERLREMELTDYYNRLADHAKKVFLESNDNVKGLIISGPGPTKDSFVKEGYLDYRLQNMIIGVLDAGYAGREGVRETIEKSGKLLENVRVVEERRLVQKFLGEVNSDSGLAIYGINDIMAALKRAAVDTIIVNDDTDMLSLQATCSKCGEARQKFVQRSDLVAEKQALLASPCPKCGSIEMDVRQSDIVDYLVDASVDSGAKVEVISSKTEDGAMLKSFGGIGALLRYRTS